VLAATWLGYPGGHGGPGTWTPPLPLRCGGWSKTAEHEVKWSSEAICPSIGVRRKNVPRKGLAPVRWLISHTEMQKTPPSRWRLGARVVWRGWSLFCVGMGWN